MYALNSFYWLWIETISWAELRMKTKKINYFSYWAIWSLDVHNNTKGKSFKTSLTFCKITFSSLIFKSVILRLLQIHIGQIWSLLRFPISFWSKFITCLACDHFLGVKLSNQILHNPIYSLLHFTKWIVSSLTFYKMNFFHPSLTMCTNNFF